MIVTIGGGIRPETNNVWNEINIIRKIRKLLYVPFARTLEDYACCLDFIQKEVLNDKCEIICLPPSDYDPVDNINDYDAIYIGGGNVWTLMTFLINTNFNKDLREYNGLIIGSSAGAIVLGKDAKMYREAPAQKFWTSDKGLNLCGGYSFACHYVTEGYYKSLSKDDMDKQIIDYVKKTGNDVCALPEDSALFFDDKGTIIHSVGSPLFFSKDKSIH